MSQWKLDFKGVHWSDVLMEDYFPTLGFRKLKKLTNYNVDFHVCIQRVNEAGTKKEGYDYISQLEVAQDHFIEFFLNPESYRQFIRAYRNLEVSVRRINERLSCDEMPPIRTIISTLENAGGLHFSTQPNYIEKLEQLFIEECVSLGLSMQEISLLLASRSTSEAQTERIALRRVFESGGEQMVIKEYLNRFGHFRLISENEHLSELPGVKTYTVKGLEEAVSRLKKVEILQIFEQPDEGWTRNREESDSLSKVLVGKSSRILSIVPELGVLRLKSRSAFHATYVLLKRIIKEFVRKEEFDEESVMQLRRNDFEMIFRGNKIQVPIVKRPKLMVQTWCGDRMRVHRDESAQQIVDTLGIPFDRAIEFPLTGYTANPGYAEGRICVVPLGKSPQSCGFRDNDIMVTVQTVPQYLKWMKKSAAIITDEGGLLCHAAILSRELQKPCIVGTLNATECLKTGDVVRVDAFSGTVGTIVRKREH